MAIGSAEGINMIIDKRIEQKRSVHKKSFLKKVYEQRYLLLLVAPGLIYYFIFKYISMYGVIIAFKNYNFIDGISGSPWVGFKYFEEFFKSQYFVRLIRNTFTISATDLVFSFPVPLIFALLLNELKSNKLKKLTQTVSYLPYFLSTVVVIGILKQLISPYNGVINAMRNAFGHESINFLMEKEYFVPLYVLTGIWQGMGYNAIVYLATLSGIDPALYEAAQIDGAGRMRCVWNITLPSLLPTISILLILRLGHLLDVGYEKIILMYNPGIYETADVISTYVYRMGIQNANYSFSTAVGLMNSVVSLVLIVVANKISNKLSSTGLW